EPALLVVRQRMRMIERAGVQPHARWGGDQGPRIAHRARQQVLAEPLADRTGEEPEISDLDRAVVGHAAQLVPSRERAAAPRDVERDLRPGEMSADLVVTPVPAVAPVIGLAHAAIALAIQLCGPS